MSARPLRADTSGSVATTFGLALLPTLLMVGAGLDYARATAERAVLQTGVDAAALAGIQAIRKGETVLQVAPLVTQVVATNDINPTAYVSKETLSSDGTTLCVWAASSLPTTLMGMIGVKSLAVGATACSAMHLDTYEVAFAFDNSGSMNNSAQSGGQTKLQAAVTAANGLIAALSPDASGAGGVPASYALVPFNSMVDVGAQYASASFMDVNAQSSLHWQHFLRPAGVKNLPASRFAMFGTMQTAWAGCVEERPAPYTTSDTAASSGFPDTLFVPFLWPDETDQSPYGSGSAYNQLIMNNYLGDEGGSCTKNDASDIADRTYGRGDGQTKLCKYAAKPTTMIQNYTIGTAASPNAGCTTAPLQPLNATVATIQTSLKAMKAGGDTALVTGFMWAWRTLSPNGPFDAGGNASTTSGQQKAKPYGYVDAATSAVNHKVIILLTDGMDHWLGMHGDQNDAGYTESQYDPNKSYYSAFGWFGDNRLGQTDATTARSLLDNAMLSACTNAKNATDISGKPAPVEVYTVGFLATDGIDAQGQSLLQSCATDGTHSFIATTGDQLVQVFQQIAATITEPRIAK